MQTLWANLIHDLRYALRQLRRTPTFVAAVIATLALGIGLNAAIFAVVDSVLLQPLGYHDADRIIAVRTHFDDAGRSIPRLGGDDYSDLAPAVTGLEATARYTSYADGLGIAGASLYVPVANVSPRFPAVMGVQPIAGRLFQPSDPGGTNALLGAAFARQHFGSVAAALGQPITYTGAVYTVIGVLPDGFRFPTGVDIWFESPEKPSAPSRTAYNDNVIAKRRPGVTPAQLSAELAGFSAQLQRSYPEDRRKSIEAIPLQEQLVGATRPTLHLLTGAALVMLLIICANLTHLQLVRATRDARALTIRSALGASRASLSRHALLQAALLAAGGTLAAILLAIPALRLVVRLAPPDTPRLADVHLSFDALLFAGLLSFAVMAVAALLPVWRVSQVNPAAALRQDSSRGTESRNRLRLRNSLVITEVALTFTLSVAAFLLVRQLIAQSHQDLGFAPATLITLDAHAVLSTPYPLYPVAQGTSPAAAQALADQWSRINESNLNRLDASIASLAAVPGVDSAAAISGAPMSPEGGSNVDYAIRGRQVFGVAAANLPHADLHPITPGLFATLGLPLLRGRDIAPTDRLTSPPVLLISQNIARSLFPGQDPLGHQIMCGYDEHSSWWTIVGVVGDIRSDSPAATPSPTLYVPAAQHPQAVPDMQLVVRTRVDPAVMVETLRKTLQQTHPDIAFKASTMRQNIGETERSQTFRTTLLASFAGVSILLAAVGMYGVTAYTVAQRHFEFGLRIALGAARSQLLLLVLRNALLTALKGVAIGIALSIALAQVLRSFLGTLPTFDAPAYGLATVAVLLLCVAPTLWPARSAASADPMQALRNE